MSLDHTLQFGTSLFFNVGDRVSYSVDNVSQHATILRVHMDDIASFSYTIQLSNNPTVLIDTVASQLTKQHNQVNTSTLLFSPFSPLNEVKVQHSDTHFTAVFDDLSTHQPISLDHHGHKYIDDGKKTLRYDKACKGSNGDQWKAAFSDELDRLLARRKTCRFIPRTSLPKDRIVSYFNPQLTEKMKNGKLEYRVRGTVGGNINDFSGNKTSYTASLPSVKILLNAVISDPDAKFMTIDLKDFFLHGQLDRCEYFRLPLKWISPADVIKYDIHKFINGGLV